MDPTRPRLVLASASPRRRELLERAGLDAVVRPGDVDEVLGPGEPPLAVVVRLARAKARAVARNAGEVVLAADTVVVADRRVMGKPIDDAEAADMLRRLSGRVHEVVTGVAVVAADDQLHEAVVRTEVHVAALTDERIAEYVATGEGRDKAGAYAIQGRAAAFVSRIDGSWSNVVGLPLVETLELLEAVGVHARWAP